MAHEKLSDIVIDKNYEEIGIEKLKEVQLSILETAVKYCEKNNLRMYLAYGSLIGVVRHGGYIPWDDDIDIWMPREDYLKFINSFTDESTYILSVENNKNYPYPYAKLSKKNTLLYEQIDGKLFNTGIYIDIFPLDSISEKKEEQKKAYRKINRYMVLRELKAINLDKKRKWYKSWILSIARILVARINTVHICERMNNLARGFATNKSRFVCSYFCPYKEKTIVEKSVFGIPKKMMFENIEVPVPCQYDIILKNIYGDYMKLPPAEKRQNHHMNKAFIMKGFDEKNESINTKFRPR